MFLIHDIPRSPVLNH